MPRGIHAQETMSGWEWMVKDGLGSVHGMVDNSVGVLESRNYDPYGELCGATGNSQTAYGFTGEPIDGNGLLYLRARYYNPAAGVFTALDPFEGTALNALSLNRYGYARGNPINYVDRSGMCPEATKEAVRQAVLAGKAAVPEFSIDGALPDTAANFVCAAQDFSGYAAQTVLVGEAAVEMAAQVVGVGVAATAALVLGTVALGALIGLQIYLSATYAPVIYTPDLMDDLRPPTPRVATPNPNVTVAPQPQPATSTPPAPQPGLQPLPMPTETCAPTATATREPRRTIVELGAGDYTNAIGWKVSRPELTVIATNSREDWEQGKLFASYGLSPSQSYLVGFYTGWLAAKAVGVQVGEDTVIENRDVPSGIGDVVYSILPYPPMALTFGMDAARIASRNSGTQVAVTEGGSGASTMFVNGFNSSRPNSLFYQVTGSPYGNPGSVGVPYWEGRSAVYTTKIHLVP